MHLEFPLPGPLLSHLLPLTLTEGEDLALWRHNERILLPRVGARLGRGRDNGRELEGRVLGAGATDARAGCLDGSRTIYTCKKRERWKCCTEQLLLAN